MRILCLLRAEERKDSEGAFALEELKDSSGVLVVSGESLYLFLQLNQKFFEP